MDIGEIFIDEEKIDLMLRKDVENMIGVVF